MQSIAFAAPLLPGKTEADLEALASVSSGARRADHEASRRRAGITREASWLQRTPDGDFPNVPGHVSNPEIPKTLDASIACGELETDSQDLARLLGNADPAGHCGDHDGRASGHQQPPGEHGLHGPGAGDADPVRLGRDKHDLDARRASAQGRHGHAGSQLAELRPLGDAGTTAWPVAV